MVNNINQVLLVNCRFSDINEISTKIISKAGTVNGKQRALLAAIYL